ncbi:MAG: tetratricopeptide repeat protein [Actinobacteria bacterium]|nr:tetratricopeptide repeat protein [Actinomycetota bacterium]
MAESILLEGLGRAEQALSAVEDAVARFPDVPALAVHASDQLLRHGRPEKALAAVDGALGSKPDDETLLVARARALLGVGRGVEALDVADTLVAGDSEKPDYHRLRADVLVALDRLDEAVAAYLQGGDEGPSKVEGLAFEHLDTRPADVVSWLESVGDRRSEKARALTIEALRATGRPSDALAQSRQLFPGPEAAPLWVLGSRAQALIDIGEIEAGLAEAKRAVEQDETYAFGWSCVVVGVSRLDDYRRAMEILTERFPIEDPAEGWKGWSIIARGQCHTGQAKYAEGIAVLSRESLDGEEEASRLKALGEACARLGRSQEAVEHLKLASEHSGADQDPSLWTELGDSLFETGALEEARVAYERAVAVCERMPEQLPLPSSYAGWANLQLKRPEHAVEFLRAVDRKGLFRAERVLLSLALAAAGQEAEALERLGAVMDETRALPDQDRALAIETDAIRSLRMTAPLLAPEVVDAAQRVLRNPALAGS